MKKDWKTVTRKSEKKHVNIPRKHTQRLKTLILHVTDHQSLPTMEETDQ